jgi:hypothetical protein
MRIVSKQLITGEEKEHETIETFCKSISINRDQLALDYNHPAFKDGIYQKYRFNWFLVTVYMTFEELIQAYESLPIVSLYASNHPSVYQL